MATIKEKILQGLNKYTPLLRENLKQTFARKVAAKLTLLDYSGSVAKRKTLTFTVLTPSDGEITATSNDSNIATVSVSGNRVTITGVEYGSTSISISQAAGTNYFAAEPISYAVNVALNVSNILNENSWETISEVSLAGTGANYWDIGDCKEITLNGKIGDYLALRNRKLCVFILDFNHPMNGVAENNIIWGGFKSALTGDSMALTDTQYRGIRTLGSSAGRICFSMNHRSAISNNETDNGYYGTNYGGWKGTDLRYDILGATSTAPSEYNQLKTPANVGYDATAATLTNPKADTLLAAFPQDLRSVMRLWTRWVDAVGDNISDEEDENVLEGHIQPTVDAITLLTMTEIYTLDEEDPEDEVPLANRAEMNHNTQLAYFKVSIPELYYHFNKNNQTLSWWLCSPNAYDNKGFCLSRSEPEDEGIVMYFTTDAHLSLGIAPAFKT